MTDFIQKKVEEAVIVITNRLEIIDTKGNGWDDIKEFLRQALIEQHNRTVEEAAYIANQSGNAFGLAIANKILNLKK